MVNGLGWLLALVLFFLMWAGFTPNPEIAKGKDIAIYGAIFRCEKVYQLNEPLSRNQTKGDK